MAVTDIIIILGILGATGVILYMFREILRWDKSLISGKNPLLIIIGVFLISILFGRKIISAFFAVLFSQELIGFWVLLLLIVGIFLVLYIGKLFKQW